MKHLVTTVVAKRWLAIALLLFAVQAAGAVDRYFRYINNEGVTVINSRIPPEFVSRGYEVVTPSGQVLDVVPPALSPEEARQLVAEQERQAELAEWDDYLLRRYSSTADIEAARERKLADFEASMAILRGNANSIQLQIDELQARAADVERAGRSVPENMLNKLGALHEQFATIQEQIKVQLKDRQNLEERFEAEIDRFAKIKTRS